MGELWGAQSLSCRALIPPQILSVNHLLRYFFLMEKSNPVFPFQFLFCLFTDKFGIFLLPWKLQLCKLLLGLVTSLVRMSSLHCISHTYGPENSRNAKKKNVGEGALSKTLW